jgi:outer membrane protein OmpA-like peptidoglycan-associated protein
MTRGGLFILALLLTACDTLQPLRPGSEAAPVAAHSRPADVPLSSAPSLQEQKLMATVDGQNSLFFASDSSEIDAGGRARLQSHAQRLLGDPRLTVTLTGHSDDVGSPAYNLALAEQRINVVHQILREQGVPPRQLRRYAVGQEKVPALCRTAECRRRMRRVDLVYASTKDELPSRRLTVDAEMRNGSAWPEVPAASLPALP